MGTVFLNKKTGRIVENRRNTFKEFSSPEWVRLFTKDYRFSPKCWSAESYYCKKCDEYHALFARSSSRLPKFYNKLLEIGKTYDCLALETVRDLVYLTGTGIIPYLETALKNGRDDFDRISSLIKNAAQFKLGKDRIKNIVKVAVEEGVSEAEAKFLSYIIKNGQKD